MTEIEAGGFAVRIGSRRVGIVGKLTLVGWAALAAGCANNQGTGGDPGARPLPPGASCQSVRSELDKLDARGVRSKVEGAQQGRKFPPQQQAEVDQYNKLLADYLGARCHVAPAH